MFEFFQKYRRVRGAAVRVDIASQGQGCEFVLTAPLTAKAELQNRRGSRLRTGGRDATHGELRSIATRARILRIAGVDFLPPARIMELTVGTGVTGQAYGMPVK